MSRSPCNAVRRLFNFIWDTWKINRDPISWAQSQGVRVGSDCRVLGITRGTFGSEPYLISIGDRVTITAGALVTHDGAVWVYRRDEPDVDRFGPIKIGNNVFIGNFTTLLPGVTVGDDCVLGAGSVVTHDIPDGSIAAGVPARLISTIDGYRVRHSGEFQYIRSMSREDKGRILLEFFNLNP